MAAGRATAVYVVFENNALDLSWIPEDETVIVVHNDRSLDPASCVHPTVTHLFSSHNVGFGAGVNMALGDVGTERVVICNPDTVLHDTHWEALAEGSPDVIGSLPIVEPDGTPTSVVNHYPTAASLVLTGWRAGRLLKRGGSPRRALTKLLGTWGREHDALLGGSGEWPLTDYWASGAILSVDAARLREVGGLDERYFLYFEDVDLCGRLSRRFPDMTVRVPSILPAVHQVRGSAPGGSRSSDRHHLASARRWAGAQQGWKWRAVDVALAPRSWWLERAR